MKNYLDNLPRPFLALAPMEDVTDTVFRRMIIRHSPFDLYFTEFVNVEGLQSPGRHAAIRRLRFEKEETPLIAQIWGSKPENFYKTAKELVDLGFAGVDINMGCPKKDVVKDGCGGGMIGYPQQAVEVIQAVKEATKGQIPVSLKTRIGLREFTTEWIETVLKQNLNMLTVHLRTVKEMSLVPAHWELMPTIKELRDNISPNTAIVGNGDVANRDQAEELAGKYGIDGVMIARGIFHDPFASNKNNIWADKPPFEKMQMYREHVELFRDTWGEEDNRPIAPLNKFCKTYVNGFPGAKEVRERLMHCKNIDELQRTILLESEQLKV